MKWLYDNAGGMAKFCKDHPDAFTTSPVTGEYEGRKGCRHSRRRIYVEIVIYFVAQAPVSVSTCNFE
jgi:hypothetical protein